MKGVIRLRIENKKHIHPFLSDIFDKEKKKSGLPETAKDTIEISNSTRAFMKVNDFLNLGKPDRLDTSDMSTGEKKEFLKMLSELLKRGIVGYEELEVDGKKEKHFIVNQIGNHRLDDAKLYREKKYGSRD